MRLIFIRHGQTDANTRHELDTGFPGDPLNALGLQQAEDLVGRLAAEPIEVVMTSDITRARQTGEPLAKAKGVPLITHPGVREIYAGQWDMDTEWRGYFEVMTGWATDPTRHIPGGQNFFEFEARFTSAIAELADYDCAAVVSHGAAMRIWLPYAAHLDIDDHQAWAALGNTATVIVEGRPGSWRALTWGDRLLDPPAGEA